MKRALLLLALLACTRKPPVPIVNWHAVAAQGDEFTVSEAQFTAQLDWLQQQGWQSVPLRQALQPRPHAVVLTFDDGTADALSVVAPALQRHGLRGAFFIVTGFVGKPGYLSWDGVRALAAMGMEIGSHSVDHARLPDLAGDAARRELIDSRAALEAQLHAPVELLAYPYNAVRGGLTGLVREAGYKLAVAGVVHGTDDPLKLYRISVSKGTDLPAALERY